MAKPALILLFVLLVPAWSHADGKFYGREAVPPGIPYQRALLLFDGTREALIIQSKYSMDGKHGATDFGWVVPVPAVPELAHLSGQGSYRLFLNLSTASSPRIIDLRAVLVLGMPALLLLSLVGLLLAALAGSIPRLSWFGRHEKRLKGCATGSLALTVILALIQPTLSRPKAAAATDVVDVLKAERVGVYDVSVVKAGNAGALVGWLSRHRFRFAKADTPVVERYIRQGWCFVAARVAPESAQRMRGHDGLADPLVLVFPSRQAVYPLALTGTGGFDTEVLLYVASHQPMRNDGRLRLRYAGPWWTQLLATLRVTEPADTTRLLSPESWDLPYLTKLKGTLSPAQMQTDLVLVADPKGRNTASAVWFGSHASRCLPSPGRRCSVEKESQA